MKQEQGTIIEEVAGGIISEVQGAVMKSEHAAQIAKVVEAVKARDIKNVYFVACGGSMASLSFGEYFISKETEIPSFVYTANEFIHRNPKGVGENTLVILRSHSGTTPETVEAASFAREKGALTVSISKEAESPLCQAAEHIVHYNYKDGSDAIDGEVGIFYTLIFELLNTLSPNEKYQRVVSQLPNVGDLIQKNIEQFADAANEFGKKNKREKIIYTMASGAYIHHAYSFTSCLLMEMLWIHSNAIHSGEFFHGPFEITDYDVPFLVVKGSGTSRPLDERALDFVQKFSDKVEVVDIETLNYEGVDEDLQEYFGPALTGSVLRLYADALAEHTGHPLSVRRYMWKMDY
ncbi:fructoselysine 6-phosphate deglycase [Planomicrobium stackebrandtii]|uniref:Fructoselysine 6-phosphate deglycase n=1 Tax=Planomicrobium stackebrandtii TaxID=253160 RepID=A0ABU0GVN9_9BACL|nr:SIS domain-containing protein [Planomicrobium stackebrandtii]MDQ0429438.1 fructoselysine 6-phosphate deglycase [Planomicrobium stackebrandtii]